MRTAAIVLAAGAASRFGSPKALARLDGRPILEHVLDAVRSAGIEDIVVVLGHAAQEIEDGIDWLDERRVRNPDPRFLSGSLQVGLAAVADLDPPVRGVVIALGDQPRTRPEVIRALIGAARETDRPVVVDGRASFATPERFPPDQIDRLVVGWPDEVADEIGLGPDDAVAVLTHDVKFDEPAIVEALRRRCRYVGAVGSRKTQGDRRARLRVAGVTEAELARLRGPVGLDLGGRAPAETALAIMSEIVAERYGGSGRPMVERAAERESGAAREPAVPAG
ncbi:MAG TPA: XdhC family protein [Candidatus Limnocylindrales bacterium]|nr:XdhC family protein [Candidatus Limnocylindrales bacterium]